MCDLIYCFCSGFVSIITSQTFWTAIGALGTFMVSYLALFPRKEKEIIDCHYWIMNGGLRVCIENKSKVNCILEKGSYLIIQMGSGIEMESEPLKTKKIIPAKFTYNVYYPLHPKVHMILQQSNNLSIYLYTQRETIVKLKEGMREPISIEA